MPLNQAPIRHDVALLSIIVPIYRIEEGYLRQCIDSLCAQEERRIEIILIDDGSPDGCGDICDEYASEDDRILVIHQKNGGVSSARNAGIETATANYIMFVDADDYLESNCCEILLKELDESTVDILFFRYRYSISGMNRKGDGRLGDVFFRSATRSQIKLLQVQTLYGNKGKGLSSLSPFGKVISRNILLRYEVRFPLNVIKGQDTIFNLYLLEFAETLSYIDYVGYNYRIHPESVSMRFVPELLSSYFEFNQCIDCFINKYHYNDVKYNRAMGVRVINSLAEIERLSLFHRKSTLSKKQVIGLVRNYCSDSITKKYRKECGLFDFEGFSRRMRYLLLNGDHYHLYYYLRKVFSLIDYR